MYIYIYISIYLYIYISIYISIYIYMDKLLCFCVWVRYRTILGFGTFSLLWTRPPPFLYGDNSPTDTTCTGKSIGKGGGKGIEKIC